MSGFAKLYQASANRIKWCCDTNLARAKQMAERFSVPDCFNDVINDPAVDMIKISTNKSSNESKPALKSVY
jgi:predicted dehydrogenase